MVTLGELLGTELGIIGLGDAVAVDDAVGSALNIPSNVGVPASTVDDGIGYTLGW